MKRRVGRDARFPLTWGGGPHNFRSQCGNGVWALGTPHPVWLSGTRHRGRLAASRWVGASGREVGDGARPDTVRRRASRDAGNGPARPGTPSITERTRMTRRITALAVAAVTLVAGTAGGGTAGGGGNGGDARQTPHVGAAPAFPGGSAGDATS